MARNKNRGKKGKGRDRMKRTKEEWEEMKRQNPDLEKSKSYKLAPKSNDTFERYYKGQGIMAEEDWETFLNTMRKPLPATFRISGARSQAQELLKIIKGQYFNKFIGADFGGVRLEPQQLPWYPDELAWQLDFTKKEIRQNSTLKSLHGFLVSETESGNISRQEAVSMIPPLLMDILPHHKILDMCAAPGSKTAQLIEMLHQDENIPVPEGFVVANDMDNKRCYLMTHQVKRIQSPNCMIINHDARILPNMVTSKDENVEFLRYDRILCDVPCSGDGTMRKNPDIWNKWHVNGGYNLHRIQKKVLQRGLELLAVGGRLVYSTCSLNPVENEAVILTLVKQCGGAVELVDVSESLPGLKYRKGIYTWKIMAKDGSWYETNEAAPENFQNAWDSTMYPPSLSDAQDVKLERCVRVLPHLQNTGAFFIAVLHKTKELPWVSSRSKRTDPIINPKLKLDPSESQEPGSEHFSFGVRSGSGLYLYAKCHLCTKLLQGKNDYNSHKQGKTHLQNLANLKVKEDAAQENKDSQEMDSGQNSDTKTQTSENTETVAMETENSNADSSDKTGNSVDNVDKSESAAGVSGTGDSVDEQKGISAKTTEDDKENDDDLPPPPKRSRREKKFDKEQKDENVKVVMQGHREDPFYFCSKDDPIWPPIKAFYDVADSMNVEQIMYRNMKRVLYYVSKQIRNLVICNDEKVKFINLGVKSFSNAPSPLVTDCDYRLSQEGLIAISPHIRGRMVRMTKEDVVTILSQENPFNCKLSAVAQEDVYSIGPGSALFQYKPTESEPEPAGKIVFCGWRGKTSVRSFVGKDERSHYLRLCGVELTDIQAQVQKKASGSGDTVSTTDGTVTPMGVPSGDEEEVAKWNKGVEEEALRGTEEDLIENDEKEVEGGNEAIPDEIKEENKENGGS